MERLLLIADEHSAAQPIRLALRGTAGFQVVAVADGRHSAHALLASHAPTVVLVIEMCQRMNALLRLREAREALPDAKVVLLTTGLDEGSLGDAFRAGAHFVLSRRLRGAALGTILREVVHGNVVHTPLRPSDRLEALPPAQPAPGIRSTA